MAHSIFGQRFIGYRKPAWHALGEVIPEGEEISVRQALHRGGIDYRYVDTPIGYTLPSGEFVHSEKKKAVLREPTPDDPQWRELGIVSDSYRYLQNDELADRMDILAGDTGWKFETVGALGKGETVFMTLRAEERDVQGDPYVSYALVADTKASGRALTVAMTPVRVVCQNTLMAAESTATMNISIPHTANIADEYEFWMEYTTRLHESQERVFAALEAMAAKKISDDEAKAIIAEAYPLPKKNAKAREAERVAADTAMHPIVRGELLDKLQSGLDSYEYFSDYWQKRRDGAFELYQRFNAGKEVGRVAHADALSDASLKSLKETPYAALQAVTELVDWSGHANAETSAASAVFGMGAQIKRRAWDAAMKRSS